MSNLASTAHAAQASDDENLLRSQQWAFLARVLVAPPDAGYLAGIASLSGDSTPLGQAYDALADAARDADPAAIKQEFFDLFVGVGRGELLPYGSFYLTGFLNERPLADLRRDLAGMGIERAKGRHEPEDHIASLCEIMSGLAAGQFDAGVLGCGGAGEAGFFARHVEPWAAMFWADLARAPSARFYRAVAGVGLTFTEIEARAFALARAAAGTPAQRANG
jgi:TorA maturation chaperone TorD